MIRLVALDIDGTLLNPRVPVDALPEADMTDAIASLQAAGIIVVLATGRMYPGTAYIADHLKIDQPLICQQGASVHERGGALRHALYVDPDIAQAVARFAFERALPLAWFDAHRYMVSEHCEQARFFADVSRVEMELHPEPHKTDLRATGVDVISDPEQASLIHDELNDRFGDAITLLDFYSVTAVHARDASKGNALAQLCDELNIPASQVLAIGDSVNDASMLSWAAHSAAPQHSDAYASAAAKEILEGEGVSGVVTRLGEVLS